MTKSTILVFGVAFLCLLSACGDGLETPGVPALETGSSVVESPNVGRFAVAGNVADFDPNEGCAALTDVGSQTLLSRIHHFHPRNAAGRLLGRLIPDGYLFPGALVSEEPPFQEEVVSFGPYTTNAIRGPAEARFLAYAFPVAAQPTSVLEENLDEALFRLDVYDNDAQRVLATRYITAAQYLTTFISDGFLLPFVSSPRNRLQYRIFALRFPNAPSRSRVDVDVVHLKTQVRPVPTGPGLCASRNQVAMTYYPALFPAFHEIGTAVKDPGELQRLRIDTGTESGLRNLGWRAPADSRRGGGFVSFGPYRNDFREGDQLFATFSVAVDSAGPTDDTPAAVLDIVQSYVRGGRLVTEPVSCVEAGVSGPTCGPGGPARLVLRRRDFRFPFAARQFILPYRNPSPRFRQIEYRVRSLGTTYVYHASTTVQRTDFR